MLIRGAAVLTLMLAAALLLAGCATFPPGTYFPAAGDPSTVRMADTLHRAARAAGDDPGRYSFAFIKSQTAAAYSDEDATFYVTDGLIRLEPAVLEGVVAHEVAHEVLGHVGSRRKLSIALTSGFAVLGVAAPGAGLLDFVVNPIVVRAFGRQQELDADRKAVDILRAMGYPAPRRALVRALQAVDGHAPKPKEGPDGLLATHPALDERLQALEPLEPEPVAHAPVAK
jgi:Zn-dependent protease with chaperone function